MVWSPSGRSVIYDGQGFLALTQSPIKTLKDLAGKQICFIGGTAADGVPSDRRSRRAE